MGEINKNYKSLPSAIKSQTNVKEDNVTQKLALAESTIKARIDKN
jgi:hypothetical protein